MRIAWGAAFLLILALSWCIPLFSDQDPRGGTLSYPPLHPVYFQSNQDAPLEIQTCLGFPAYFREQPYRISRPTYYAALAGLRDFLLDPLARLVMGDKGPRWGAWSARETLITYFLWLFANAACVAGACLMGYRLLAARLPSAAASLAVLMLLSTPIVLLAMREIHLNAYQILTALACLAFWDAALAGRLSTRGLIAASLLLGLLFLGKPNLNLFGAGAALCLWLKQGRKLLLVVPLLALPTLLWMGAAKAMGLSWSVPEVTHWKAGVWIIEAGPALAFREFLAYVRDWFRVLGESLTPVHVLLAAIGGRSLWKGNLNGTIPGRSPRALLALAALLAAADFAFYFLVHRVHAVYYVGTLLGIFALAALGLLRLADLLAARLGPSADPAARTRWALASAVLLQAILLTGQLPAYPG